MPYIIRNPEVMWREEDEALSSAIKGLEQDDDIEDIGTAVLFRGGTMISLNYLGMEIWKICDRRESGDIVRELLLQFEVEEAVLKNDVEAFLDELEKKGFIRYEQ